MTNDAKKYFRLAEARHTARDFKGRDVALDQAITLAPNNTHYILVRARYAFWRAIVKREHVTSLRFWNQVAADCGRVIELSKDIHELKEARRMRILSYDGYSEVTALIEDLSWFRENASDDYEQLHHDFDERASLAQRYEDYAPTDDAEYYFEQATLKDFAHDYVARDEALDTAISLDPTNTTYILTRARYMNNTAYGESYRNYRLARPLWEKMIADATMVIENSQEEGERSEAYRLRSIAHDFLGETEKLINDLSWLIDHNNDALDSANLFGWRAIHYQRQGRFAEAIADYDRAFRLNPIEQYAMPAWAIYNSGDYERAIEVSSEIIGTMINRNWLGVAFWIRSKALHRLGRTAEALIDVQQIVELRNKGETVEQYLLLDPLDTELAPKRG